MATVSEALRGSRRVRAETRSRVEKAARKAGYERNPLLGAALSAIRRSRQRDYQGTIALIDRSEGGPEELMLFHREIAEGARDRARELGFRTELFWQGDLAPALSQRRLPAVLFARGIAGAVLLPFDVEADLSEFNFSRLAAVQMDHCLIKPRLHAIMPDHYVSLWDALDLLTGRGYRRIGLCLEARKDIRVKNKWSAAFQSYFNGSTPSVGVPLLIEAPLSEGSFLRWYGEHRPDLIVGHREEMIDWLKAAGVAVPGEAGFCNLNLTEAARPCAGLDLQPRRLGATAIESVAAMLYRDERGVPAYPHTTTLEAVWVEGPTVLGPGDRGRGEGSGVTRRAKRQAPTAR